MVQFLPKAHNFMRRIVFHGCARPWYVYVETFFPAFIKLAITVAILDLEDVIRDESDKLARSGARKSRRSLGHTAKRQVQVREVQRVRYQAGALKVLLKVTQPLETFGFAFLLYSAGDEFFYDWQSLIEQSPFCTAPVESGPFSRADVGGQVGILPGGDALGMDILEQNRAGWPNTPFSVTVPGGIYHAVAAITVKGPSGGHPGAILRLQITGGAIPNEFNSDETVLPDGQFTSLVVDAEFYVSVLGFGSIAWTLVGAAVPVGLELESMSVFVQRVG